MISDLNYISLIIEASEEYTVCNESRKIEDFFIAATSLFNDLRRVLYSKVQSVVRKQCEDDNIVSDSKNDSNSK